MIEFREFPKMARLSREICITEKIDGTNAAVVITEDGQIAAQSRSRLITPEDDNYGFAAWVRDNAGELMKLGPGHHFGEWWGMGIQRKYGMTERRFSLFNVIRWASDELRPACCHVVPTLYIGQFDEYAVSIALDDLKTYGSKCAPGFMRPEGIVIYHTAANIYFKKTLEKDEMPKAVAEKRPA